MLYYNSNTIVMLTKQELVTNPTTIAVSKIDDAIFPLLTDFERGAIIAFRELIAECNVPPEVFRV